MAPLLLHYFWESAPMTVYVGAKKRCEEGKKRKKQTLFRKKCEKSVNYLQKLQKRFASFLKI
jgi:hypothetical protein